MDIAQTLENLTLNKGKLDYATILKLQETLADACRIHDETHADEMAAVLEKMRLRGSEGAADAAPPQPAYDFTSPGRGAASDAQWSPTPLGADGERSVERAMFGSAFSPAKRVSPETPVFVFGTPVAASDGGLSPPRAAPAGAAAPPAPPVAKDGAKDKKGRQGTVARPKKKATARGRKAGGPSPPPFAARAAPAPAFEAPDLGGFHIGTTAPPGAPPRPDAARRLDFASMDVDDEPPPPPAAVPPPPAAVPGVFAVGAPPPAPPAPRKANKAARSPAPQSTLSDAAEPQSVLPPADAPMDEDGGPTFSAGPKFTVGTQSPDRKPASAKKKDRRRRSKVDAPKDPGALEWYERAGREYEGGDYDGATRSYGVALKLAVPGWALAAKALGNRGAALTMLGKHEEALEDCDAAVELEPTLAKVHNRSARLRLALGLPKAASRSFERARDAAKRLVDDARLRGAHAPHDALNALQTADAGLVDVERYKDALRRCGAALDGARQKAREAGAANDENAGPALFPGKGDESPTTPDEPRRHGSAAKKRRDARRAAYDADCDKALKAAEDALLRAPLSRDARLAKASALHRLDKWRECAEFCETCATTAARPKGGAEDDRGRAARVALALARASPLDESPALGGDAEERSLAELWVWTLRCAEAPDAACDGAKSLADAALAAVAAADVTRGPSPEERRARTRCELELNRATKTRRAKVRADDAYARGHYRAAAAMYKDALRLDAFDELDGLRAAIHCNVAACALVLDRGAEAADHCSRALRLRPGYLRARLRRARARSRSDDLPGAVKDFDHYVRGAAGSRTASAADVADAKRERRAAQDALDDRARAAAGARARPGTSAFHGRRPPAAPRPAAPPPPPRQSYAHPRPSASSSSSARAPHADAFFGRARGAPPPPAASSWRRRDDKPKPRARPASSSAGVAAKASHHAVLGVASDAPPGVVKKAYAKLALKFHPDRNDSPGATAAMARINEAYEKAMEAANSRHR